MSVHATKTTKTEADTCASSLSPTRTSSDASDSPSVARTDSAATDVIASSSSSSSPPSTDATIALLSPGLVHSMAPVDVGPLDVPAALVRESHHQQKTVSYCSSIGRRREMQDSMYLNSHFHLPRSELFRADAFALYLVCDGHGHQGERFSQLACIRFHVLLEKHCTGTQSIEEAISAASEELESSFRASMSGIIGGTCFLAVLLNKTQRTLFVCNLGDCRACVWTKRAPTVGKSDESDEKDDTVMSQAGSDDGDEDASEPWTLSFETVDHKATLESERLAIEATQHPTQTGVFARVVNQRLQGTLTVSRAFGNYTPSLDWCLSRIPDCSSVDLTGMEHVVLVMASDGLWDTIVSHDITNYLEDDNAVSASFLVQHALEFSGAVADNVSVITLSLRTG